MDLSIPSLKGQYQSGSLTPARLLEYLHQRIKRSDPKIWIYLLSMEELAPYLKRLAEPSLRNLPLYGIPFAIKDNIDLANVPTTVACPEYAYSPRESAHVVQRLVDAGAIPVGKTNLDQFATGLSGTRSPYGIPSNPFDPRYIPGGSSSGSAVAVANGMASFSLGTDTAGSGRIPASLNNLVGLKPSRGLLSTRGLFPACRSLDCISILSLSCEDARCILDIAAHYDVNDPFSVDFSGKLSVPVKKVIGLPRSNQLEYFGDTNTEKIFRLACSNLEELGFILKEIDFTPFQTAARLLYEGPWLAERYLALEDVFKERPDILHPVTRQIIEKGGEPTAVDFFRAQYRLASIKRVTDGILRDVDAVMTPTCGTIYTIQQMLNDPIRLNTRLGYYTNFMNLLNLAAVAVPCGIRADGIPQGVTLFAPAGSDCSLLELAGDFHARTGLNMGAGDTPVPPPIRQDNCCDTHGTSLVVCGAHMRGMPLNHELTDRGACFVEATRTAPLYRLFSLDSEPARPALVQDEFHGEAIEVEVWRMPVENIGGFLDGIAAPLGLGRVSLHDGRESMGFIAEAGALHDAADITEFKSWRKYQQSRASEHR
jgi:allophanate hydrolase